MKEFEKYMEWHLDHWADICSDKNDIFEDDLKRFKRWVAYAGETELMCQLLGRFESLMASYIRKGEARKTLNSMEHCYRVYLKEKEKGDN